MKLFNRLCSLVCVVIVFFSYFILPFIMIDSAKFGNILLFSTFIASEITLLILVSYKNLVSFFKINEYYSNIVKVAVFLIFSLISCYSFYITSTENLNIMLKFLITLELDFLIPSFSSMSSSDLYFILPYFAPVTFIATVNILEMSVKHKYMTTRPFSFIISIFATILLLIIAEVLLLRLLPVSLLDYSASNITLLIISSIGASISWMYCYITIKGFKEYDCISVVEYSLAIVVILLLSFIIVFVAYTLLLLNLFIVTFVLIVVITLTIKSLLKNKNKI